LKEFCEPAALCVQDETNVGKNVRCYAADSFHGHPKFSNVQISGTHGKWFAELLIIFELPEVFPSIPLVFVREFDQQKHMCPIFKLPMLKKTNICTVILLDSMDQLVDVIPDSLEETNFYCHQ